MGPLIEHLFRRPVKWLFSQFLSWYWPHTSKHFIQLRFVALPLTQHITSPWVLQGVDCQLFETWLISLADADMFRASKSKQLIYILISLSLLRYDFCKDQKIHEVNLQGGNFNMNVITMKSRQVYSCERFEESNNKDQRLSCFPGKPFLNWYWIFTFSFWGVRYCLSRSLRPIASIL